VAVKRFLWGNCAARLLTAKRRYSASDRSLKLRSSPLPCLTIRLGSTKTTTADDDAQVVLIGRPVIALKQWLAAAKIDGGH
jgi:hypothetical protein